jgi:hypothetical protein
VERQHGRSSQGFTASVGAVLLVGQSCAALVSARTVEGEEARDEEE